MLWNFFSYQSSNYRIPYERLLSYKCPASIALRSSIQYSLLCNHKQDFWHRSDIVYEHLGYQWTFIKETCYYLFEYFIQTANNNKGFRKQRIISNHCMHFECMSWIILFSLCFNCFILLPNYVSHYNKCIGLFHEYGYHIIIGYINFELNWEGRSKWNSQMF